MRSDDDWHAMGRPRVDRVPSVSPVRVALLFGSAAIALGLMATSYLDRGRFGPSGAEPLGLDAMTTGSIGSAATPGSYIIRRSVLQSSRDAVCIIRSDGTRSGDC